jgi:TolA-binding protein
MRRSILLASLFFLAFSGHALAGPIEDALRAMAAGEVSKAVSILDNLAGPQALLYRGRALYQQKRYPDAERAFKRVVKTAPPGSHFLQKATFGLAECQAARGRFEEAERLFAKALSTLTSTERRERIAERFVLLGDEHLEPAEGEDAKDPASSERFYRAALEVVEAGKLAEKIKMKVGRCLFEQKRFAEAAAYLEQFLTDHEKSPRRAEALFRAGKAYHRAGNPVQARRHLRDLLAEQPRSAFAADAAFLLSRTHGMPRPANGVNLVRGQAALRRFVKAHPDHKKAEQARLEICLAPYHLGRQVEAEDTLRAYIQAGGEKKDLATATYTLGASLAAQGRFVEAAEIFEKYLSGFPSQANWLQARAGIEDMLFRRAERARQKEKFKEAAELYSSFGSRYPTASRAPEALYLAGTCFDKAGNVEKALQVLGTLTSKFPQSNWAVQGWLETGRLLEEQRSEFVKAREAYKKAGGQGATRMALMEEKSLLVEESKIFRSGQKPQITWHTRNLESVSVRVFRIQAEDFFRDSLNMEAVLDVDIALCKADKSWTVPVKGYQKFKRIEQKVPLPIQRPGLYLLNLTAADLEATTAVLLSDLGVVLKTGPGQAFAFAQDLKTHQVRGGTRLIIADEEKVLLEGKTGADGVFLGEFPDKETVGEIRAFAFLGDHLAWTRLESYPGGKAETAATPRAFLFTDRPIYRPGDSVHLAGIVRDEWSKDSGLSYQPGRTCDLSVQGASGSILFCEKVELDEYGVFHHRIQLDEAAHPGHYSFTLRGKNRHPFSGHFRVQAYRLSPYDISVTFDRPVVFRGEELSGTIRVRHQSGAPAGGKVVGYMLAGDAAWKTGITDASGQVRFSFKTRGYEETQKVQLKVRLPRENLIHDATAMVAVQGFEVRLEVEQKTLFAGQPFDLKVMVRGPDDRPHPAALRLEALHRRPEGGEVRVFKQEITVGDSGEAGVPIRLVEGGFHVIRVFGHDRAGNPIIAELGVSAVGSDEPGLFLDVDRPIHTIGTPAEIRIESRMDRALVLLAYETDRILGYRSVLVQKGQNTFKLPLERKMAPNFLLSACAMDGDKFYTAARSLRVSRHLKVDVRPDKQTYAPGDEVTLTIVARDADERPVDARLIVSVVDEALLRHFPENLPDLLQTFYTLRSEGEIHTVSSNTHRFFEVEAQIVERAEVVEKEGSAAMTALSERRKVMTEKASDRFAKMARVVPGLSARGSVGSGYGAGGLGMAGRGMGGGGVGYGTGKAVVAGGAPLRQYFTETAAFSADVKTGPDGVASVVFRLPDTITTWRVTTRGVTRDTQLGEDRTKIPSRAPFWAELVLPEEVEEGDRLQPVVRLYNETKRELDVQVALTSSGKKESRRAKVPHHQTADVVFPAVAVGNQSAGQKMEFLAKATAKDVADRLLRKVPVRPRGIREQVAASGHLRGTLTRHLQLADGLTSPEMEIRFDARMTHLFLAERLDPILFGDRPEAALVALNLLELLDIKAQGPMPDMVRARLRRALIHLMAVQRSDGGWGWCRGAPSPSLLVTAGAVRALARVRPHAGSLGWNFPQAKFDLAVSVLKNGLTNLPADDWMRRSTVLYALSHLGKEHVPFVHLHRLHRLRKGLPLGAQALLGLTWVRLERPEKAGEVAEVMRSNVQLPTVTQRFVSWMFECRCPAVDIARALELLAEVNPADPLLKPGAAWLLRQGTALGWLFPREAEAASRALLKTLGAAKREERIRVTVVVNGQPAGRAEITGGDSLATRVIRVDPAQIKPGKNTVKLSVDGSGSCFFVASLSGYRQEAPKPEKAAPVKLVRFVEPVPLPYKGREIKAGFSVVLPSSPRWINQVKHIPAGRRIRVTLEVRRDEAIMGSSTRAPTILFDRIPPGFGLVEGSARGSYNHMQRRGRRLAFYLGAGGWIQRIHYELMALNPGSFAFPPTSLVSVLNPRTRALGGNLNFKIDESQAAAETIRPTPDELYQLGVAAVEEKEPGLAVEKLEQLNREHELQDHIAREVLGKLLFAAIDLSDNQRIVKYFELAKEKNPSLVIPFDKIGPVQTAYRALKAFEGGLHLARGVAQARFLAEVRGVGILESEQEMAEALSLLKELLNSYPDNQLSAEATYAFSQVVYGWADAATEGEKLEGFDRAGLLDEVIHLMARFLGSHPRNPQAPPAIYSLASALLERGESGQAVAWSGVGLRRHPESDLRSAIAYLKAFAHFKTGQYAPSLKLCKQVVDDSEDEESRQMAQYIMAQIHHARGEMDRALSLYRRVQDRFRDAHETVQESETVLLEVPDVINVSPGRRPVLEAKLRNLERLDLRVYRVDLLKLYLLKGSLRDLAQVNLAGIRPVFSKDVRFRRKPGVTQEQKIPLRLPGKGAYLVLIRGGPRLIHSLVLTGSLATEVTEDFDEGRVRVTVRRNGGRPVPGAQIQLKGTENHRFIAGKTDLRGIFIADEIEGAVTVIAHHQGSYGLYRGTEELVAGGAGDAPEPQPVYKKKTVYDFEDDNIEGQLLKPQAQEAARDFFNQDIDGMSVEQAK